MSNSFSVKSKWLLLGRKKVICSNTMLPDGDCLAIKLEGDLKSWTKYFGQIQFWGENFRTHFQIFFCSRSHFWIFLSTQDPILKFLLILGLIF